jgi:hypothetical protein
MRDNSTLQRELALVMIGEWVRRTRRESARR